MEKNDHGHGQGWSERQIGVYHRFGGNVKAVMVLLHANTATKAHSRLQQVFSDGQYQQQSSTSPLLLHALILSSYLDNWRPNLQQLGAWCLSKENQFLTVGLKHPSLCFQELQELRDLESRLLLASGILHSSLAVVQGIESCGRSLMTAKSALNPVGSVWGVDATDPTSELRFLGVLGLKCTGYFQSVDLIHRRVNVVIGLLSDGLSQQSQKTANNIADSSFALTQKSVNDSYIVKVVTVITVVYLPMQGVATFFGMNLTGLSDESDKLRFAHNWWLFLATALPLTLVTLGVLWIAWRLEKKRKSKQQVSTTV
ncbi:hypothetical protein LTR09_010963 [Extremus antarcticus]|uniref:Uncharacterized protein n=1 Tax=Extremus antarcticus TaxID=702011 RepID=A0AAJ0DDC9_9PEZI|nr:hypothetical protein LTR09_010963 [Extremus antarcticus]